MSKVIRHRRANGQYRRSTLQDFGIPKEAVSDGGLKTCAKCGETRRPVMVVWICTCGHENGKPETKG